MTEKSVIRQAPFSLAIATSLFSVLIGAGAYSVLLSVKNDQIAFYREKLGELPAPKARYSIMRNEELKKSAMDFAGRLRDRISIYEHKRQDVMEKDMLTLLNGVAGDFDPHHPTKKGTTEFEGVLREVGKRTLAVMEQSVNEYEREFRSDAIAIRDELQARLPVGITKADPITYLSAPGGLLGGRLVADDIERLARMLP